MNLKKERARRFGYHNPCDNTSCSTCKIPGQMHLIVEEEIFIADYLNEIRMDMFRKGLE